MAAAAAAPGLGGEIIGILSRFPDGASNENLQEALGARFETALPALQSLLDSHRIEIMELAAGKTVFRLVNAERARALSKLSADDTLVLQAIEEAGNKGVWTRILKLRTKLQQAAVTKSLKRLEQRGLVNKFATVTHKNRKMYIAAGVTPAKELTGGPWYQDQELDHVLIETLRKLVYSLLGKRGPMTRVAITDAIASTGVVTVKLGVEDVQQILDTLIYDAKIAVVTAPEDEDDDDDDDGGAVAVGGRAPGASSASSSSSGAASTSVSGCTDRTLFARATLPDPIDDFSLTPCGVCPVFDACTPGGLVSPERCVYLDAWERHG